jgi:hypothetical protein
MSVDTGPLMSAPMATGPDGKSAAAVQGVPRPHHLSVRPHQGNEVFGGFSHQECKRMRHVHLDRGIFSQTATPLPGRNEPDKTRQQRQSHFPVHWIGISPERPHSSLVTTCSSQ